MSDQPVTLAVLTTALAQFHREVVLPDIHRVVEDLFERRMKPRFDEIDGHFDRIYHKLDKLETEFELLKVGLARVEERLKVLETQYSDLLAAFHRLEERLARIERNVDALVGAEGTEPLRAQVADLRARVDSLQAQVRNLESRLDQ